MKIKYVDKIKINPVPVRTVIGIHSEYYTLCKLCKFAHTIFYQFNDKKNLYLHVNHVDL